MIPSTRLTVNFIRRYSYTISYRTQSTGSKNADQSEVNHFSKLSEAWWNPKSKMAILLKMNDLRVPFVRDGLVNDRVITEEKAATAKPLENLRILDVGCGGGFFSMPLARLGADVTGLDPSTELIRVAEIYAEKNLPNSKLKFLVGTIEEHAAICPEYYDIVVSSEVVEHVSNKDSFIKGCVAAVKPQGSLFFTTISQTKTAWLLAIIAAENIFNFAEKGTHQYDKLITPEKLSFLLEKEGCCILTINGMFYNPLTKRWTWSPSKAINYALHAIKDS